MECIHLHSVNCHERHTCHLDRESNQFPYLQGSSSLEDKPDGKWWNRTRHNIYQLDKCSTRLHQSDSYKCQTNMLGVHSWTEGNNDQQGKDRTCLHKNFLRRMVSSNLHLACKNNPPHNYYLRYQALFVYMPAQQDKGHSSIACQDMIYFLQPK
jgi:hypothetical protein